MNGESDLRYSNKRQLEAEEDSGTNSDLTEKHSSDVRQIPMVRNTSRYFLCFKCKSPARTNHLVTNSRSLQRNVWKTLKRNMKIPSAVLLQNLWNVLHLNFHILILRCVLNDYRFNFIDWFVCRYRQTILCLWQSEHRSFVLYAVGGDLTFITNMLTNCLHEGKSFQSNNAQTFPHPGWLSPIIQVLGDWRSDAYKCNLDISVALRPRLQGGRVTLLLGLP